MLRRLTLAVAAGLLFCQCVYGIPNPENGVRREYHPNGKVRLVTVFKKGRVVRSRTYYPNGRLMSEFLYRDSALQRSRTFYGDGVLRSEWSRKAGIMRYYSSTGTLTHESILEQ